MNYRIALIHGFFRNYKDMEELENNLMNMGYTVDNLNFPLTFPSIDMSINILKKYLLSLKEKKINKQNENCINRLWFWWSFNKRNFKIGRSKWNSG